MQKSSTLSDLISPEYLAEQQQLHADPRGYGGRGSKWAATVVDLTIAHNVRSILDYGCGQASLQSAVSDILDSSLYSWRNYDPAMKAWARVPDPAVQTYDLVVCTDVLEHIEPEKIDAVLGHISDLVTLDSRVFTVISTVPTAKTLSDGRQAHILLQPLAWWMRAFRRAGLELVDRDFPNPKPEKQLVNLWRPV